MRRESKAFPSEDKEFTLLGLKLLNKKKNIMKKYDKVVILSQFFWAFEVDWQWKSRNGSFGEVVAHTKMLIKILEDIVKSLLIGDNMHVIEG